MFVETGDFPALRILDIRSNNINEVSFSHHFQGKLRDKWDSEVASRSLLIIKHIVRNC